MTQSRGSLEEATVDARRAGRRRVAVVVLAVVAGVMAVGVVLLVAFWTLLTTDTSYWPM